MRARTARPPYHGRVNDSGIDPTSPGAPPDEQSPEQSPAADATAETAPAADTTAETAPVPDPWADDADTGRYPDTSRGADHGRSETVRRQNGIALFATVVMLVVLAFGGGLAIGRATAPSGGGGSGSAGGDGTTISPRPIPTAGASAGPALPSDGPRLGRADAKVTVDYWADFQCPFCAKFAQEVIPQLDSRIADGTVALVHRDYAFLGAESVDAAVAVQCAGRQGKYWAMHDAVYAAQAGENQGGFAPARLAQVAASVGLDPAAFAACVGEKGPLLAVLESTAEGVRSGVVSTPTIDVNGNRFSGVPDVGKLLAAIDAAAAGASPAPLPTAPPTADPWAGTVTDGRVAGAASAPVTVELWTDYQSKDSAVVTDNLEPELRTRIASGAIRVVQRDLAVLGDESVAAATMVRCVATQGGPAWFVHDILSLSAQGAGSGIYTTENLLRLGARLGLDMAALDTCLADPAVAAEVKAETDQGTALGLTAAPSVVIRAGNREVGRFLSPLDTTAVLKAIDAAK